MNDILTRRARPDGHHLVGGAAFQDAAHAVAHTWGKPRWTDDHVVELSSRLVMTRHEFEDETGHVSSVLGFHTHDHESGAHTHTHLLSVVPGAGGAHWWESISDHIDHTSGPGR